MRELDFLPKWYSQLQRRRRLLALQIWMSLLLIGGLGLSLFLVQRNQRGAAQALDSLQVQLTQTRSQLQQMDRLEELKRAWGQKAEVLRQLGVHVESARLVGKLSDAMPDSVSLLGLVSEAEETPVVLSAAARAALKDPTKPPMERRLRVRLQGVAPTDVEMATFLTELTRVPFLDQVQLSFVRERPDPSQPLREFEITFVVDLNVPLGS